MRNWVVGGLVLMLGGVAEAEQIRLKDGTEFTGYIADRDGPFVVIQVESDSIATVDGAPLPPPVAKGEAAPEFSVVDLDGGTQTLGTPDGEATMVHFWASWCPFCRTDVPLMKDLYARYQGKGLRMVMVSVDQERSDLDAFIRQQNLPYPVVAARSDPNSNAERLPDRYESRGIPAYYLVDVQGIITEVISGSVTESDVDLEGALQRIIPQ